MAHESLDLTDLKILRLALDAPKAGMREFARVLSVARGTVQSRIARLEQGQVIRSYAPDVDPARLGYTVLAFVHLHLAQGKLDAVVAALAKVPEVLEAHTTTGDGDILCRVVGRDNAYLEDIVQRLLAIPGVVRTRTEIALNNRVQYRLLPLVDLEIARLNSGPRLRR
jgi:DNA-binding Lrp family transcriptional regulator